MARTLPEKIVAVVEALVEDLADWSVAGRDRTLAEHEAELLARGAGAVQDALREAKAPTPEAAEVLRGERGYFAKHAERMAYPLFRLDGLPLGSGAIESAADHLVQRRMKRAGMRWSDAGGDAMLPLRARLRSQRPLTPNRQAA